jgi:hypothetical protein
MRYLADDPRAETYLALAQRLQRVYAETATGSDEQLAGQSEVIDLARRADIPKGRIPYISGLAIGLNRQQAGEAN